MKTGSSLSLTVPALDTFQWISDPVWVVLTAEPTGALNLIG